MTPASIDYDELVREGVSLIPAYAPQWTDHNAADPGITLLELLAYFSDILAWRALRVTPDAKLNLLQLLEGGDAGSEALRGAPLQALDEAIQARVRAMAHVDCAVTPADFERLALAEAAGHAGVRQVRAMCVPGLDLRAAATDPAAVKEAPGDATVLLVPEREIAPAALEALCRHVERGLAARCLLTSRVHVIAPVVLHVRVACRIALEPGSSLADVLEAVDESLRRRFGPVADDEPIASARPLGRSLYLSEIAEAIDTTGGVDYVEDIELWQAATRQGHDEAPQARIGIRIGLVASPAADARLGGLISRDTRRLLRDDEGAVEALKLHPWELVRVRLARDQVGTLGEGDASAAR